MLRLVFTCCHPALAPEARVALSLRTLCGLATVGDRATRSSSPSPRWQQRIVRAKHKIAAGEDPLPDPGRPRAARATPRGARGGLRRLHRGSHARPRASELVRVDLCDEAIRLARVLAALLPDEPEVLGLLALLLLTDARRATRVDAGGDLVLLADQDRARWDGTRIAEGAALVERVAAPVGGSTGSVRAPGRDRGVPRDGRHVGRHRLAGDRDALRAPRGRAPERRSSGSTAPSPSREVDGPDAGLALVDAIDGLERFHHFHSTRADLLRRLDRDDEAAAAYRAALGARSVGAGARFLSRRLADLG